LRSIGVVEEEFPLIGCSNVEAPSRKVELQEFTIGEMEIFAVAGQAGGSVQTEWKIPSG
jgi:hypothetical protein